MQQFPDGKHRIKNNNFYIFMLKTEKDVVSYTEKGKLNKRQNYMNSEKKITSADVARAAGCSQSTVSKVVNHHPHVSEFLRQKVLEQARKLNYNFQRGKVQRVAVILPAPWRFRLDGYVSALLNALIYVLYQRNIRVEIVQENDLEILLGRVIDGGISISWEPGLTAEWFEHFQLPLVRINANPAFYNPDGLLAHVNMDSEKSMKILLEKLYSMGHRRIHLLAPDSKEIEERRTRYQGFYRYMKSRRIQHPEQYCIFGMRENSVERNLELLKQAVTSGVTALIAVDEGAVRSTLSLIEKLKLNVPERISVVGWEQKDVLPYFNPPITGMAMDYTQLSEAAVDLLSGLCKGESVSDVYFPFRLIERESIAPVYRRKQRGKLAEQIIEILSQEPKTRGSLAAVLGMQPYSGYFSRTISELLRSGKVVYGEKSPHSRVRFLCLTEN